MEKIQHQSWWKLLSVLILLYCFTVGMLTPLKPNLNSVASNEAALGEELVLEATGYNTRFGGGENRAWLRAGDFGLEAREFTVTDDRRARLRFDLPDRLPEAERDAMRFSLVINNPRDGAFVVPDAVLLRSLTPSPAAPPEDDAWTATAIRRGDLNETPGMTFPYRGLLAETIRNTYFHVSLWFAMMFLFIAAFVYAIKYLRRQAARNRGTLVEVDRRAVSSLEKADYWSQTFTGVGMLFGVLGLLTGAVWAKYTWGSFWSWDIKQFTTLIALLIYAGYFVLRASFRDGEQRARLGAVYNIFAFACLIPLIYILPRLSGNSLHPGAAGNPALGGEDLDNTMRMVFYPTIIGWTLFGAWMVTLGYRIRILAQRRLGVR